MDLQISDTQFNKANLAQKVIDGVQSALNPPEPVLDSINEVIQ